MKSFHNDESIANTQSVEPRHLFPFSAISGQEHFKLALLLAAINPLVSGVLVCGPRGSAKSTLAKGLADILPQQDSNTETPFVTLPLGASEEMLIGTLDLQKVLTEKDVAFQPGLFAKSHQGILYVDEVNLLPDNLVDQLLDVAASGINVIERDGISYQHSADFILLGTMNPDEGELRPQLMDRFGLSITLSDQYTSDERIDIVKRREQFDKNPHEFITAYRDQQQRLTHVIEQARKKMPTVECPDHCRHLIAERCMEAHVDGLRADIVWTQAAISHSAYLGNQEVTREDVLAVEALVLAHRRNDSPSQTPPQTPPFSRPDEGRQQHKEKQGDWGAMPADQTAQSTQRINGLELPTFNRLMREKTVRSSHSSANNKIKGAASGQYQTSTINNKVNWFTSIVANRGSWPLKKLYFQKKKQGETVIHLVLLDTSGSTVANNTIAAAKGVLTHIAEAAYLKREQFALLGFGNQAVSMLVSLRRAPKAIDQLLNSIKAGGGTPIDLALLTAEKFQKQQLQKHSSLRFKNYIITDGRVSTVNNKNCLQGDSVVIDVEQSQVKRGKAKQFARFFNAEYVSLLT